MKFYNPRLFVSEKESDLQKTIQMLFVYCLLKWHSFEIVTRPFRCVEVRCRVLQCVAVCCSVLQCVAVCCSVLQCAAVYYRQQ